MADKESLKCHRQKCHAIRDWKVARNKLVQYRIKQRPSDLFSDVYQNMKSGIQRLFVCKKLFSVNENILIAWWI